MDRDRHHLQAFSGSQEHAKVLVFLECALREEQAIAARSEVMDQLFLQLAGELDKIRQLLLHLLDLVQRDHLLHLFL